MVFSKSPDRNLAPLDRIKSWLLTTYEKFEQLVVLALSLVIASVILMTLVQSQVRHPRHRKHAGDDHRGAGSGHPRTRHRLRTAS
jgi:hypothetical protein